jgi:chemotaxis protein methyltransferase CheR
MASGLDVIMCRNVLIYFEQSTQNMIVHRFRALIADDGLLIMGHSENIGYAGDLFTSIGKTVYRPRTGSRSIVARE